MATELLVDLTSAESIKEALKLMPPLVKALKRGDLLDLKFGCLAENGQFTEHMDTSSLSEIYYISGFENAKQPTLDCPELIFFDAAIQFPELRSDVLEFINFVISLDEFQYGAYRYDYEVLVGYSAAMALAASDKKYIEVLTNYLNHCDMDHEVRESGAITLVVDKFGWCKETFDLLIARCTTCSGQHGHEQLDEFLEGDLSDYIKIKEHRDYFYKKMDEYLREEHGEKYKDEMEEDDEFAEECGYLLERLDN